MVCKYLKTGEIGVSLHLFSYLNKYSVITITEEEGLAEHFSWVPESCAAELELTLKIK